MQTRRSSCTIIIALLLLVVGQAWAGKEVGNVDGLPIRGFKDNDGDSFYVHCGDKEFRARLYFCGCARNQPRVCGTDPGAKLAFGITLDETMKAGVKAKDRVKELLQKPFVLHTLWATAPAAGENAILRFDRSG